MKKLLMIVLLIAISYIAKSQAELQVFEQWGKEIGSQFMFHKSVTKTDGSGNVYVAGATVNGSGNYDILVAKYNSGGIQQWIDQYDGYANYHDFATALFVDGSGNVYVTGTVTDTLMTQGSDIITMKYNSSGSLQWATRYRGSGGFHDSGADVVVDGSGNVYITGGIFTTTSIPYTDAVTIKYNSSGTQQWATIYNNSTYNKSETGARLRLTGTGKVVVSGAIQSAAHTYIYGVLEYNTSTGAQVGGTALGTGSSNIEYFGNLQIDSNYNYYIAGASYDSVSTGYDYYVMKLDSTLAMQWEDTYDGGAGLEDMANDIQVDASGNVYITGYTTESGEGKNITTLKYDSSGNMQWHVSYNDTLNGDDAALAMTIKTSGEIYITGYDSTYLGNYNYVTIKYDASGSELWKIHHDGMKHLKDKATNICIDTLGDVVVTGLSETAPNTYEYTTVKYVEKNIITPIDAMGESPSNSFLYYRNKGQLISTDSTFIPEVKYYTNNTYPSYYFKNDTMSMVFASIDTIPATDDTLHRIDMVFLNSNPNKKVYSMKEQSSYLNYFLGHCPDGVTGIHGNQYLVVPDLYANIDLIYSSNQNGIKYYFVIKQGGKPKDISWQYYGATSTYHNTGTQELTITSDIGSITFDQPFMYQIDSNNDTINGSSRLIEFEGQGSDSYLFAAYGGYDDNEILIIEVDQGNGSLAAPAIDNLQWSTYAGGNANEFTSVHTDNLGCVYVTGYSTTSFFPLVTSSTVQPFFGGTTDIIIIKFNPNGSLNWGTFYGGTGSDVGYSIGTDMARNVFVVGYASAGLPLQDANTSSTSDYFQPVFGGGSFDMAIIKLDSLGFSKLWVTYYGGSGTDYANEMAFDKYGNIYIVGNESSYDPSLYLFPQAGTFNDTIGQGIILKFKTDGTTKWITRFGGTASLCEIRSVCTDGDGKVYIGGYVTSGSGFPVSSPPANSTYGGGSGDGFITKLDHSVNNNSIIWSTYYGGAGNDQIRSLKCDSNKDLIYTGITNSDSTTFPLTNPFGSTDFYQGTYGGGANDIFMGKITNAGTRYWSTYYGGINNERSTKIAIDWDNNIYVTGIDDGGNLPFPSPNLAGGYVNSYQGANEAFVIGFIANLKNVWTTYFGGSFGSEGGQGIATYQNSKLYIVGNTQSDSTSFPIVEWTGAYNQPVLTPLSVNGFIAGFDLSPVITVSVEDILAESNTDFIVYPNPSSDYVNIFVNSVYAKTMKISIVNILGQELMNENITDFKDNFQKQISLKTFADGIYVINILVDENLYSKKIIKN